MISVKNTQVGRSPIEVTLNDVSELLTVDAAHALLDSLNDVLGEGVSNWEIEPVSVEAFARSYMGIDDIRMDILNSTFRGYDTFFVAPEVDMPYDQILVAVNYSIYLWCCLRDPHKYFDNKPPHQVFDILSTTNPQFLRDIDRTLKNTIDPITGDNWYESKMQWIMPHGMAKTISIPHRKAGYGGIRISYGGHVEGYNLWLAIVTSPRLKKDIDLYRMAKTNLLTRFSDGHHMMLIKTD